MSDFLSRLIEEQAQLADRAFKLKTFLESEKISSIDPTQQILLRLQYQAMLTYEQCLIQRLKLLQPA